MVIIVLFVSRFNSLVKSENFVPILSIWLGSEHLFIYIFYWKKTFSVTLNFIQIAGTKLDSNINRNIAIGTSYAISVKF